MRNQQAVALRWQQAIEAGELGVWDLRPELEIVHHSPQWKLRLGFADPHGADSTHFWRCRVHPDDLEGMLAAIHAHTRGSQPLYEANFRLRSNGSGYRLLHSRGRVVERDADGRAVRLVGAVVDLTTRPSTPLAGLPDEHGLRAGPPALSALPLVPFHRLLGAEADSLGSFDTKARHLAIERDRVLRVVEDLLHDALRELEGLRSA